MDASQSALVSSVLAVASLTNNRIGLFINLLTGFSGLLLAVIAGTFGLSWWKQNELKKEAEKDARKINNLAVKVTKLYATVQKNTDLTTDYVKAADKLIKQLYEKTSKLDSLITDVQKKGKDAADSAAEIKQIKIDLERANQGLGTLSVSSPPLSGPTIGSMSDYLTGYTPSESASERIIGEYTNLRSRGR